MGVQINHFWKRFSRVPLLWWVWPELCTLYCPKKPNIATKKKDLVYLDLTFVFLVVVLRVFYLLSRARDQISFRIIKSFKEITEQIIKNMGGVKEKVILHYKNSILAEKDEENSVKN